MQSRKSILFIVPLSPPLTGQSIACEALLEELSKRYTVEVVNFSKGHLRRGINSFTRINEALITLKKIRRKSSDADVIYLTLSQSMAGNLKDLFIYAICFKKLGNMVIHLHGGGIRKLIFDRSSVLYHINKFFLSRIGAAVVLSRSLVRIFDGMIPPERFYTVSNFAGDDVFLTADDIREKFANFSRLKILFLSNLIPGKGFEELAEAYNLLDFSLQRKVQIDFAGDFESDQQKIVFLNKIKDRQGLRYHGLVQGKEKKQLFANAHVFCLPTYYAYEGQPISILEAYASGCAVITTDHGGIPDVFEPGRTGFFVEKRSAKSIADAIRAILSQPEQLEQIAVYNNTLARNLYTKSKHLSAMVDIIEEKMQ
jgi:glycosyltransferase involved in cell wall biosynthesis